MDAFDVIIIGLGANGSSAAYHLSTTGCSLCGIDRFRPPHRRGSSHGQSRIIRQAYYENPIYVPLVKEAYKLWNEIEYISGKRLFLKTGGIMIGSEDAAVIKGSRISAETYNIPYEYLDNKSIKIRFPVLNPPADAVGVLEKEAGILFPEACIQTYLEEAVKNGASLLYNERVMRIIPNENSIKIITDKNSYQAAKLIVTAGAWMNELTAGLHLPLTVERQVLYWFKNRNEKLQQYFSPDNLPVYICEYLPGKRFYGFPDLGDGIKIALHHYGKPIQPDALANDASSREISNMAAVMAKYFTIDAEFNYSTTCMYTNTPDENFIIDYHPLFKNICIASPCSGHGFKFSSLTGKILCGMAIGKSIPFDLSPFSISRF